MGRTQRATLCEVDIAEVLGIPFSMSAAAAVLALDDRLDLLERGRKRYGWATGDGDHRVGRTAQPSWGALGRVLSYPAPADDLYELALDVWRHEVGPLVVQVTVVVGCFCPRDDVEIHTVADREWEARSDVEVRDALAAAVTNLEGWSCLDLDPDGWRAQAGLPLRRP